MKKVESYIEELIDKCENDGVSYIAEEVITKKFKKDSEEFIAIRNGLTKKGILVANDENTAEIELDLDLMEPDDADLAAEDDDDDDGDGDDVLIDDSPDSPVRVDDPVRMYLKEIGSVELISKDKEVEYSIAIERYVQADVKLKEHRNGKIVLSDDELEAYKIDIAKGEIARGKLIEANLRLVVSIAKKHTKKGLEFLDLIQEGNMGLMKSIYKFDYTKGYKFSTYATWWIRQSITRAVADQARTIRVPVHMVETINKLRRTQRQLVQELGREATPDEIAERMEISVDKVQNIQKIAQEPISLEAPVGEEEDSSLGDFISDKDALDPLEYTSKEMLKKELDEVLHTLTDREEKVLRLRFGLQDGKMRTLEEVGRDFGVTRERIRQIEAKALRKLKHPLRSNKLKDFAKY